MKKITAIIASIVFLSVSAIAADFMVELKTSYFAPSEQIFKDVYGSGMTIGGEIGITLWKGLGIWAGADYFSRKGELTFTEESTKIQIIPLYAGIRYQFQQEKIAPYIGLGIGYFRFKETNPIGKVEEGDIGYIGQVGCLFKVVGSLFFDIKGSYSYCKAKPMDIKADMGGLKAGIGIGFEF
ncbi:MAG: outer membrane beta-barrel protein [Candidatus Aminicenantes bacterium]|nr:MAG: outer membrane beta-barrel protein [Candidatus Aminicenantes bacterium]